LSMLLSMLLSMMLWMMLFALAVARYLRYKKERSLKFDWDDNTFTDFSTLGTLFSLEVISCGFIIFVAWLKLLRFMSLVPEIGPHSVALFSALANSQIGVFFVFFMLISLAFAGLLHVAFGSGIEVWKDWPER